jgi:thiamine pyrophosphate-dependent acetolactate synthase large subunit-like protein
MVVLAGQVRTDHRGRGAWQEVDLASLFAPVCKTTTEVAHAGTVREATTRALASALSGRPGPVLISLPVDLQEQPVARESSTWSPGWAAGPDPLAIEAAVRLIRGASRPLLIVGGGVRGTEARDALERLVVERDLPVVTAFRRADVVAHDLEQYVGGLGLAAYCWTRDVGRVERLVDDLDAGIVGVNDGIPGGNAHVPFGGFKQSGVGSSGGRWGLEEYLRPQYVSLRLPPQSEAAP